MYYVIAGIIVLVLAYVFSVLVSNADKKRLENASGIHVLFDDGSTARRYFFKDEDKKVWLHDYTRGIAWPTLYDSLEQVMQELRSSGNKWGYKVIPIIILFWIFSCSSVSARDIEDYQRLKEDYTPVLEKVESARTLDNFFENRISMNLLKSNNPFLRMILLWQCFSFMRDATILELQGEAPWMNHK